MSIKQRGSSWQVDLFKDGKRLRKSFSNKEDATKYLEQAQAHLETGTKVDQLDRVEEAASSLKGFFETHFDYIWGASKHPKKVRQDAGVIFRVLGADTHVRTVDDVMVMNMIQKMYNQKLQGSTINRKLAVLSKLLKHAQRLRLIDKVPHMDRQPEGVPRLWYLDDVQERDLLEYLEKLKDDELRQICGFFLHTGARWGDLERLKFKDWNERDDTITFGKLKQGGWHIIPVMGHAKTALVWAKKQYIAKHGDGPHRDKARIFDVHYDTTRDRFQSALRVLDIYEPGMGFHLLRHTCASRLVQRGIDLYVVQRWLAHKNINTTQRYAKLHPRNLTNAATVLTSPFAAD